MEKGLPKLMGAAVLALLMFSCLVALPAQAQEQDIPVPGAEPVWATINAAAQGNYPGGNEVFSVFVVNSAPVTTDTLQVNNMTLTAPFGSNFGIGLPSTLGPGQSLLSTIALQIPANFSQKSFTANLVVNGRLWNGTAYNSVKLTGSSVVDVLALPGQSGGQSTSQSTGQPASQSGTISTALFAAGVAIPSLIVIVLLVLLVQARGRSKPMGT